MGEIEGCSQTGGLLPNGLMPNARPLIDSLDSERWLKAEERTAELITCIQPNQPSEERRNAVADYVQRLIMNIFPCQVFTFGSVPLKTYLPDGDIDLTAFSNNPNLKDSWASEVVDLLQTEEKNENAEFHVKEVQYIQAEVKIIKCFVENIVVDISFNQLGGLCTLCFLEEIDNLINQNHLFKRSIILIKAWCYYESRILGAHHGLISTYALETLVLYIFHVFNNSFAGPLEVLYRFLELFSKFDWDNFCVSLWGPVPINSLPDVTAEPPRKDSGELLLNKVFLDACSSVYAVFPAGQDTLGQPFLSKHFNVIDPLRVSNNLGRSVSKGNFFRIRSAFAYGAKTLARLLDCPKENLVTEINQFFTNTWDRHGNGIRPDAPVTDLLILTQVSDSSSKKSELIDHETDFNDTHSSNYQSESSPKIHANRGQQNLKSGLLVNDIQRSPFARTRSSPELTDTYKYVPFQGTRNKPSENEKNHNRRKNIEPENEKNNPSSLQHAPPHQSFEASNIEPNIYPREDMNQEEQDLVNMMASSQFHGYNGPVNLASGHLPFPIPASFLASLGYTQRNFPGIIPTNMPFIDPQFPGMQFPHGLVPHYFPGVGMNSKPEDSVDQCNENNLADDSNSNHDFMNSEIVPQDDKPQSSSTGMSYVPPPRRVGGSGGLVRSQPKNSKEKHEQLTDNNHLDHNFQYSDERATISRFSSESSWDEISSTVIKSSKEKRGKKMVNRIDDGMQSEDDDQEWVRVRVPSVNLTSDSESQTVAQTSGSGPVIPMGRMGPMIIGSNPRQRMMDNSGGTSLTFYPTGPPVPFLTMLPFYNVPSENGVDQSDISQNFHSEHQSEEFSLRETPDGNKSDILNSDFASHWHNLQFGRFCQSPRHHGGPTGYPSPVLVPPVYLQGRVPWDGPGRPMPNVTQIMNYGPRLVPVAPLQSVPNRPLNVYQHYVEDMPRYRSGTGTYLPNPKVGGVRERPRRGNYNYEKSDNNGDREGNWTVNSKSRGNGRNHNHNQMDKSTTNRLGSSVSQAMNSNSHRQHDSFSGSSQSGPSANMVYGMYPSPGVSNNGLNGPAVVMEYPYEQNASFAPQSEQQQLEFRSFGSGGYSGINEQQSPRGSSPDQSSSPHHHRRV